LLKDAPAYRLRLVAFALQKTHKELKKQDIKLIIYNNRLRLVGLAEEDAHRKKVCKENTNEIEV